METTTTPARPAAQAPSSPRRRFRVDAIPLTDSERIARRARRVRLERAAIIVSRTHTDCTTACRSVGLRDFDAIQSLRDLCDARGILRKPRWGAPPLAENPEVICRRVNRWRLNVGFWAGRTFGRTLLLKHGHRIGINERELILGEYLFQRYGGSIVFFGRFVAFLRVYPALLAGANWLHPLQFTKYNASGGIVWAAAFGIAGALGQNMLLFAGPLGWLALAATAIGAFWLWSFYKTHEEKLMVRTERALTAREKGHLDKLADRRGNK